MVGGGCFMMMEIMMSVVGVNVGECEDERSAASLVTVLIIDCAYLLKQCRCSSATKGSTVC